MFRLNNKKIIRCLALAIFFFIMAFMIYFNTIESNLQLAYALDEGTETIEQKKDSQSGSGYLPMNIDPNSSNEIIIGDQNITDFSNIKYIPNGQYFLNNPLHADNNGSDNPFGTCTTVAFQMLIGYHNYYSDRRLVPSSFLDANYGDLESHPFRKTSRTPNLGDPLIGTKDELYRKIFDNTLWASSIGQNFPAVMSGVRNYLNECASSISSNVSLSWGLYSSTEVQSDLNNGLPVIIGFDALFTPAMNYHVVVAYGTATYNNVFGYLVHWGWRDDRALVWIPESFCQYMARMSIRHDHSFSDLGISGITSEGYYYEKVSCNVCNCITYDYSLKIDNFGTILPCLYSLPNEIEIPSLYLGKRVTAIGDEAFSGYSNLTRVSLPDTLLSIGVNAFSECTNLENVVIPNSVTTIKRKAFYDCYALNTNMPTGLTTLGESAFGYCSSLMTANIPSGVTKIENNTFKGCQNLTSISLPSSITEIGEAAFMATNVANVTIPSSVTVIKGYAFALSGVTSLQFNGSNLTEIGEYAFSACSGITGGIVIPQNVATIGNYAFMLCSGLTACVMGVPGTVGTGAFDECSNLTVYTKRVASNLPWSSSWNPSNRPVIWGYNGTSTNKVSDFIKSATNPTNSSATNGINNPVYNGFTFNGWYTTADYSGTQYSSIATAPNGTLYAKWTSNSCIAAGSLVTLADGSQVAVENLTGNESLLVWNMFSGSFDVAPILFIDSDPVSAYEVTELTFADGTKVKVIYEHGFFDVTLNKYVYLRNDAAQYIGHYFNKQSVDEDGNRISINTQLTAVNVYTETTTAWSPVTAGHLCYYVNGMLSMPAATEGFVNTFDVDPLAMKYDEAAMAADVAQYGLFTYEEFYSLVPVPEYVFNAFNGQYLKVAIGKGLITIGQINELFVKYAEFF